MGPHQGLRPRVACPARASGAIGGCREPHGGWVWQDTHRHLDRAVVILQDGGQAIEAARSLYWRARVSLQQDRLTEARQDLETSRTVLEQLGAAADLQRVDKQLAEVKTTS